MINNSPVATLRDMRDLLSRLSHHVQTSVVTAQYEKFKKCLPELRKRFPDNEKVRDAASINLDGSLQARTGGMAKVALLRHVNDLLQSVAE